MAATQAEVVIHDIISRISYICSMRSCKVSDMLTAFMVKTVIINPKNGFLRDVPLDASQVNKLVEMCVERLCSKSIEVDTIKMQVEYDMNYAQRDDFLREHRKVKEMRMRPLMEEIVKSRARNKHQLSDLYQKIVSFSVLKSGLGDPTSMQVVRDSTAALQRVLPQSELTKFVSLSKAEKEKRLEGLERAVTGIRLFNKECGKEGEGIDDLTTILNEAVPTTLKTVDAALQQASMDANIYGAVMDKREGDHEILRHAQFNARQMEVYLKRLLADIIDIAKQVELLNKKMEATSENIRNTVDKRSATPTDQIFPSFIELSKLWVRFEEEMSCLSSVNNVISRLHPFCKTRKQKFTTLWEQAQLGGEMVASDAERSEWTAGQLLDVAELPEGVKVHRPDELSKTSNMQLRYNGFCGWSIANMEQAVPGSPNIGIVEFENNFYAFASKEAAYDFIQNPQFVIDQVTKMAMPQPDMIQLFNLIDDFAPETASKRSEEKVRQAQSGTFGRTTKVSTACQTPTHFTKQHIDNNYFWNEWDLRRQALKLADLKNKKTKSSQTGKSSMRRDISTQASTSRISDSQTANDNHSNVSRPQIFIQGLRGIPITKSNPNRKTIANKVDLTVPVNKQ